MNPPLLAAKLNPPPLPPRRVPRPHLSALLDDGLAAGRPLALISAPAGWGKTLCAAAWARSLECPVAWLALDAGDDEPGRFFTYLVAALQGIDPRLGHELGAVLRSGQLPPAEIIAAALSNDILARDGRFVLVLDDFQQVQEPSILAVWEQLLATPPPPLHLLLLTREDPALPLARLRANNQLTEIRAAGLRFSGDETQRFLNEVMGLDLAGSDVAALEARTEGWVAGLQLAALALQAPRSGDAAAERARFIASLSGSHRHILGYLTEEVLDRQPPEVRRFLRQTAVLERLNGDLCDAVTGGAGSDVLLERLLGANLFLVPLDEEGHWYRYHALFLDLLRDPRHALPATETAELHRRAAAWYESAGLPAAAIDHAIAAADYDTAVRLLEAHAMDMLMEWRVKAVARWQEAIPPPWRARSPRTNLAFAWLYLFRGDPAQAMPYVAQLGALFAPGAGSTADPALRAEWLALQATLLSAQGQAQDSIALAEEALALAPPEASYLRGLACMALSAAHQQLEDHDGAVRALEQIIAHGRAAGHLAMELLGYAGLGILALDRGELHRGFELASQGAAVLERAGALPPIGAALYGELAAVHYAWHRLAEAQAYFRRATQVSTLAGFSDAAVFEHVIASRLAQLAGDLPAAAAAIGRAVKLAQADTPAAVREEVVSQQVRVYLAQDQPAAAAALLAEQGFERHGRFAIPGLPATGFTRASGLLYTAALRLLLYRAAADGRAGGGTDPSSGTRQEDMAAGLALASELLGRALDASLLPLAIETLLLRAQVHALRGDVEASQEDARRALQLGEPEGFITVFLEEGAFVAGTLERLPARDQPGAVGPGYVRRILDAFTQPVEEYAAVGAAPGESPPAAAPVETLTERELEVLQLMAQGLKYREIAARLYISLNTVRSHVKVIYGKLAANNRTQAIARAREQGLL